MRLTRDVDGESSTEEFTSAVIGALASSIHPASFNRIIGSSNHCQDENRNSKLVKSAAEFRVSVSPSMARSRAG